MVGYKNIEKVKTETGPRYAKVTPHLELSTPEVITEIQENLTKITDSILILLSSKSYEDLYPVQGKFKFKNEIVTRVNQILTNGHVKDVYFSEFIIQ